MGISIATRCLDCGRESSFEQRDAVVGPIRDELVTGTNEADGITRYEVEKLYTGRVTGVKCPFCVLRIWIAADLAPWTLSDYLLRPDPTNRDLDLTSLFHVSPGRSRLKDFPLSCPRCAGEIVAPEMGKQCSGCGSRQLQILGRDDI